MEGAKDNRKELGNAAEEIACQVLTAAGWKILERNFSLHDVGELDVVAERNSEIVFVEVRSASTSYLESPAMTVDRRKQSRVVTVARVFLHQRGLTDREVRFDVIAVWYDSAVPRVEWIEDAFRPAPTAGANKFQP